MKIMAGVWHIGYYWLSMCEALIQSLGKEGRGEGGKEGRRKKGRKRRRKEGRTDGQTDRRTEGRRANERQHT